MYRTPNRTKPDAAKVQALIDSTPLKTNVDLKFEDTGRTLRFFRRYNGQNAYYSISRADARNWLITFLPYSTVCEVL